MEDNVKIPILNDVRNVAFSFQSSRGISNYFDKNPFYKDQILILRTIFQVYAEISMNNFYPILFSFLISFSTYYFVKLRYDHIFVRQYDYPEMLSIVAIIIIWNYITSTLSKLKLYKIQFLMSRIVTIILYFRSILFQYSWLLTPGTNYTINIDYATLLLVLWNSFVLGIVVLLFPVPQRLTNYYIIYYSSQIGLNLWIQFPISTIKSLLYCLAFWDLVRRIIPYFTANDDDYTRGLYFSNFIVLNKRSKFFNMLSVDPRNQVTDDVNIINENKTESINQSNFNSRLTKKPFSLNVRSSELLYIEQKETLVGIQFTESYGINGLQKLEMNCKKQIENGVHMDLLTIIFYISIIIFNALHGSMVGVLTSVYLIACTLMVEEAVILCSETTLPFKLFLVLLNSFIGEIIPLTASPCFKRIALLPYFSIDVMEKLL